MSSYDFREMTMVLVEYDAATIVFVKENRFRKTQFEECRTAVEEWCRMLKNMEGLRRPCR